MAVYSVLKSMGLRSAFLLLWRPVRMAAVAAERIEISWKYAYEAVVGPQNLGLGVRPVGDKVRRVGQGRQG